MGTYAGAVEAGSRSLVSPLLKGTAFMGVGYGTAVGIGLWAERHYTRDPLPDGSSPGYTDRFEARDTWSGHLGVPQYAAFTALLSASLIYSRMGKELKPAEYAFSKYVGYAMPGGLLFGTMPWSGAERFLSDPGERPGRG